MTAIGSVAVVDKEPEGTRYRSQFPQACKIPAPSVSQLPIPPQVEIWGDLDLGGD
jgi:hypothetical protein